MFAAKPHEAEQELPKSIPEPRNVTRECRRPVATGDPTCSEPVAMPPYIRLRGVSTVALT
jgi:hypothetical protein